MMVLEGVYITCLIIIEWLNIARLIHKYDGDVMEPVPSVFMGKEHIPIFQDESIFHTNEYQHRVGSRRPAATS